MFSKEIEENWDLIFILGIPVPSDLKASPLSCLLVIGVIDLAKTNPFPCAFELTPLLRAYFLHLLRLLP